MEDQTEEKINGSGYAVPVSIVIAGIIIASALLKNGANLNSRTSGIKPSNTKTATQAVSASEEAVVPSEGVDLPVVWGDLGAKLVSVGAIDAEKMKALYEGRGEFTPLETDRPEAVVAVPSAGRSLTGFSDEYQNLLLGQNDGKLKITKDNAGYILNLFWALGLASKNSILDSGEMMDARYGGAGPPAGGFASTAGWTIAKGDPMDHYSRHKFFNLTPQEQALVDKVSKGIYRPCCNNSTHFPDCNHGMAMLGFLELMASQGVGEEEMYKAALAVNSYWFPDTYLTIAAYMKQDGVEWKNVSPKDVLGINYSSASGYARVSSQVTQPRRGGEGSGCGVDTQVPVAPQRQQGGCGV
ncbi:MAG: hypothetical protein A3H71_03460 [Candidatus Sungbacteria bacterium RIFCSPLOWO2_02_FULL_48_13b]|uniref:Uncharacterized protein n=2 Tax=Candidatus Sungiibacteriota TaxID=1817917 RepID=A0A1G2LFE0_9BACT|nr:MAG: hypothetical protein A3C12_02700 [Candidatus Sungbacteria bacterium RIFCSPHIGHO2_02_FULL_49_20]OHA10244.1 MAG: hypothetical protein A3H71_03460 [Candidatus Sungbacteria bacterium RIFCSPLOWO2_02_FULL_48_13b]